MFKAIKEFFVGKPAPVVDAIEPGGAPYKVPKSAATIPVPLVVEPVASIEDRTGVAKETPVHIQNAQRQDTVMEVAVVTVEPVATVVTTSTAPAAKPKRVAKPKAPAKAAAAKAPAKAKSKKA